MIKLRSMVINADKSGVDSTGANDNRITAVGQFIRRYKLDELTQSWNVFKGDMSLVGPRPNVKREIDLCTAVERKLLGVKPGITDIFPIGFSDEGDILKDQAAPDIAYNQLIRPGKSMLRLLYIENRSLWLDIKLCFLTVISVLSPGKALAGVQKIRCFSWLKGSRLLCHDFPPATTVLSRQEMVIRSRNFDGTANPAAARATYLARDHASR